MVGRAASRGAALEKGCNMASTEALRGEFERYMDSRGVKYSTVNSGDNIDLLSFDRHGESTRVYVDFDEEGEASTVHFCVQNFAKVKSQDLLPKALLAMNGLNRRFRWLKFHINTDNLTITADCDAKVFPGSVGEECTEICFRAASIIEDAFEDLDGIVEVEGEESPSKEELLAMLKQIMAQLGDES